MHAPLRDLSSVEVWEKSLERSRRRRVLAAQGRREMARRRQGWTAPAPKFDRGYGTLYLKLIGQADSGCDFDFLQAPSGDAGSAGGVRYFRKLDLDAVGSADFRHA